MSVVKFAEEFAQLLVRWRGTTAANGNDTEKTITPLSSKEIIKTMEDVLQVIIGANLKIHDYTSMNTPATGIAVCTPTAPTVPKICVDQNNANLNRYRSLDALTNDASESENLNLPDSGNASSKSEEQLDTLEINTLEALPDEKKFISRSSPALNLSAMNRSDTFVRGDMEDETKVGNKSKEEIFDVFDNAGLDVFSNSEKTMSRSFFQKIEALRQRALDVVSEIDSVKKEAYPQSTNPIRRLSCVGGGFPGLPRSSTMLRPVPPKLRRASTAFPGTPTSSKLNTTITADKGATSSKRKHLAPSIPPNAMSKANVSAGNKSPLSGGKPGKNPKYAHVQSTIPKPAAGRRKAQ